MVNRQTLGNSLAQYGIALALVALLIAPVLMIFGEQIKLALGNFLEQLTQVNIGLTENVNLSNLGALKAGELGGTPNEPVEKCSAGKCTIDYGTVILHGIPENYSDVVDSAGASGGTKINLALMEQIASQLEESNPLEASKIRELIKLGNDIIKVEDRFEANKDTFASNISQYNAYFAELATVTNQAEYNALNSKYENLINSTQDLFHDSNEMEFEGTQILSIDTLNVANALHPEGAVFWSPDGNGSCGEGSKPQNCSELDPDGHYNRNISNTSSFEDYINGVKTINPINNNWPLNNYPPGVNPEWMTGSSNTPTGTYFIKLKSLIDGGGLNGNPAAKELVQSLSKEIYGMTNELIAITQDMYLAAPPPENHGGYNFGEPHDLFGIDQITTAGTFPPSVNSAVKTYQEGVNALMANPRDGLDKTLICTPARATNPKYADKCN